MADYYLQLAPNLGNFAWNLGKRSRHDHFARLTPLHNYKRRDKECCSSLESTTWLSFKPNCSSHSISHEDQRPARIHNSNLELCQRCEEIDFCRMVSEVDDWDSSATHLGNYRDIIFDQQCPMCNLFSDLLANYRENIIDPKWDFHLVSFPTSALYGNNWTWEMPPEDVEQTISFSIIDDATFRDVSRVRQPEYIRAVGCLSPVVSDECFEIFGARLIGPNVDFEVVKSWLNYCDYHHRGACISADELLGCSTSVIDCKDRKIIPLDRDYRYLALSYVWGKSTSNEPMETYVSENKTLAPKLPNTIEDAMTVTMELGYSYLWVDRYCIPQTDNEERRLQITQMDKIYARAEATIIAAAGDDPHFGLSGISNRRDSSNCVTINNQVYTFVPPDPAHEIEATRWNSRAWTYQESALSRRRLVFCKQQVYFECSAMHCYEAMQSPLHLLHSPYPGRFSEWNEPGLFLSSEILTHPLDQLLNHLSQYTARDLTYVSDALNAMLGIFGLFNRQSKNGKQARSNDEIMQIGGIPIVPDSTLQNYCPLNPQLSTSCREEQFLTGLRWKLKEPSKRRIEFPSWSWLGWYGIVSADREYDGYIRNTHNITFEFGFSRPSQGKNLPLTSLEHVVERMRRKDLEVGDIPILIVEGQVIPVRLRYIAHPSREKVRSPNTGGGGKELQAFIDLDGQAGPYNLFSLTTDDGTLMDNLSTVSCCGLILGVAQGTFYAGSERESYRTLNGNEFSLIILVLREQNGKWERLGLIEHNTYRDTIHGVRKYLDISQIQTTRQRLQLE